MQTKEFLKKARSKHGDKYDYSHVKYRDNFKHISIICPKHGAFLQSPKHHLYGRDCPKCAYEKGSRTKANNYSGNFIRKARSKHGDRYDYTKVQYRHSKKKVTILCRIHGEFQQTPNAHLKGQGCPKCGIIKNTQNQTISCDEFISRSNKVHGDKYDYSKIEFKKQHTKVTIICPLHGDFEQLPYNHLNGHGCPLCPIIVSNPQQEIINFVRGVDPELNILVNDRNVIYPYEIDILIDGHIGIEYHGLYFHSYCSDNENKDAHQLKHIKAAKSGINLIQIFADEWLNNKELVKSMICNRLGLSDKIYARNCEIAYLTTKEYNSFCDQNHIYGAKNAKYRYGLTHNGVLVCLMSLNKKKNHYEIERMCSSQGVVVVGGASKMFKHFIRDVNPNKVISYCDARFGLGDVYVQLGMTRISLTKPGYMYTDCKLRLSRWKYQKHKLSKIKNFNFSKDKSEPENMFANGFRRIWDAGHYKYEWNSNG